MGRQSFIVTSLVCAALALTATSAMRAQQPQGQQPAAPTGPLAPEKYKDIQVLKDVPADQLDLTMRYFVAATGLNCSNCHQRDQATGVFTYEATTNTKATARKMITIVQTINAGDFGARINCGTCHQGLNRPAGLLPAVLMTPDQLAAMAARQGGPGAAGRGGPPAGGPPAGGPPAGGAPPAGAAGQGGGRAGGAQPPAPAVDDVLNKYIEALGGQAAVQKLQSLVITGNYVTRANQTIAFTIEEKGNKYRETSTMPGVASSQVIGFDGSAGWAQTGTFITDLERFQVQQLTRLNDLPRMLHIKDLYTNVTSTRANVPAATPGGTPTPANVVRGTLAPTTTEQFLFDANTGLLLRRQITTQTPLNGRLTETFDYSDYKPVNGVMMPFTIKRNNWSALDTLTITDIKVNPSLDDARFKKPQG